MMDEALFNRLVEEAWDRSTEVESISVTSLGLSPEPSYPRNQQARFLRALVELVADECAKVCDDELSEYPAYSYHEGIKDCAAAIRAKFTAQFSQPDPNQRQPGEG